ncbi:rhomboid family intramembrane serine protease [Tunicatimonas pelagia]|uniref:rhomboid family intramembrane serine protease n=1 Tax=Tunicatimonas pelagia TaxID=931531 RepID=UPI002667043D|nr:rhomboid family intramembrane serine protease [Tunicatimonas pelagia]WKN40933.1 rhomboid family intramembrane serine protease [Tunicatimonas pelagia]
MKESDNPTDLLSEDRRVLQQSILFAVGFAALLWLIRAIEWSASLDLGVFGILPRTLSGMVGIITAPLVHGTFLHLLSNTFPLILLLVATFYFYNKIALEVFLWIYLITGFWVWVAARQAYHIGSSGIVYGLAAFLLFSGIFRKDIRSVIVAVAIAFLYNGMLQGLLPNATQQNVSWESHLLGSVAGVFCSFYFRASGDTPVLSKNDDAKNMETAPNRQNHTFRTSGYFTSAQYSYTYSSEGKERQSKYVISLDEEEGGESTIVSEI